MLIRFKGSAVHNLTITGSLREPNYEGLLLGKDIMVHADIHDGQEIIITRIGADSWGNRIRTVVHTSKNFGDAVVCGSLTKFLSPGELTCVIGEVYLDDINMKRYTDGAFPIFDLGFDPQTNTNNMNGNLDFQFSNHIIKGVYTGDANFTSAQKARAGLYRLYAQATIMGLVVNKTHPDCLQGSAELPGSVMNAAGLKQYKSVTVYNQSVGGAADTYAVPMPEGTVMTTGAMASFAKLGETVNIISYVISTEPLAGKIVLTDGVTVI